MDSDTNPSPIPDASLETARRVHQICERFEAKSRRGEFCRIEEEIQDWNGQDRALLLFELIVLECELCRDRGESPHPEAYLKRFPADQKTIETAFAHCDCDQAIANSPVSPAKLSDDPDSTLPLEFPRSTGSMPIGAPSFGADYVLIEEIGRGGQGVVYKSYQVSLKRVVALKTMIAGRIASESERERFRLEAERAANLVHSHIVPIHAVGEHEGHVYFTMELVDGGNLAEQAHALTKSPRRTAWLVASVARAIHFAHGKGFIHCDLKPANILLNAAGKPHVTDFGLSRTVSFEGLEISREVFGTPSYMAPEQASGRTEEITPATDVYGLGAILYELLTGRPPFRAGSTMETVVQVLEREPLPPRMVKKHASPQLERICLKCLEKSPKERFASAGEVAGALESYLRGDDIDGTTVSQQLRRWTRREPELVSRLGGLCLMSILTEYNYRFVTLVPIPFLHYRVQAIFVLWAAISGLFQHLLRKGRWAEFARFAWAATDVIALTRVLSLLEGFGTDLVVGYPLLIAASGLWFRVRLVWLTTTLAVTGYSLLYLQFRLGNGPLVAGQYFNIILAALFVTGFVAARQVKRILALSTYYESMPKID